MNKYIFTLLLLLLYHVAFAQKKPTLINTSLTKPEMAIMYAGVENVIMVYGEIIGKYIRMERSGGSLEVRPGMAMRALLKYTEVGFDTLRVFDNDKLIIEKVYEIKTLGSYAIGIKGTRDSVLTKEEFLKAKSLELFMPGGYYKPKQKIYSYTIFIYSPNKKLLKKINVLGNEFINSMKDDNEIILPGCIIEFNNFNITSQSETVHTLKGLKIVIK
jgi:hypothetical protein